MLFASFLQWWYGVGWARAMAQSRHRLTSLTQDFSILILLKTLFAPWKQMDAYGSVNGALGDKFRHQVDKFISRFVGFGVRSLTLLAAGMSFIFLLILGAVWIIIWPFLPLLVPVALLYSAGIF